MMNSVRLAFDDDLFSDLTLKFNDETVRVHKVILYRASGWFKHVFDLQAIDKEPTTNIIELHDDDPEALRIVLDRCYKDLNEDETSLLEACGHDLHYLTQVYLTAHKYGVQSAKADALRAVSRLLAELGPEPANLVASQWFAALDAAFAELLPASADGGLEELHAFLVGRIRELLPVMLSEDGGAYAEFRRVLDGNGRLGAAVVEVLRAQRAVVEVGTKRRRCGKCHAAFAITVEAGAPNGWEPGFGCFACGFKWTGPS